VGAEDFAEELGFVGSWGEDGSRAGRGFLWGGGGRRAAGSSPPLCGCGLGCGGRVLEIGLVCNHHGVMMGDGAGIARGFWGRGAGLRARRGVVGEKVVRSSFLVSVFVRLGCSGSTGQRTVRWHWSWAPGCQAEAPRSEDGLRWHGEGGTGTHGSAVLPDRFKNHSRKNRLRASWSDLACPIHDPEFSVNIVSTRLSKYFG
jgi:hypothetical protein